MITGTDLRTATMLGRVVSARVVAASPPWAPGPAFAESERNVIRERQVEGIRTAVAKTAGKYRGRPRVLDLFLSNSWEPMRQSANGVPKTKVAAAFGVDHATLYRASRNLEIAALGGLNGPTRAILCRRAAAGRRDRRGTL